METEDLRIKKLRDYLFNVLEEIEYNYKRKNSQINVDFLSDKVENYSLDKIPVASVVERWITGVNLYRDVYSFRSRMSYSADVISNIKNIGFFEMFENLIEDKNRSGNLPDIEGIQTINCLNCGTFNNGDTNTAEFDIQLQITYRIK